MPLESVELPAEIRHAVTAHAGFCSPLEACGLLASDNERLRMAFALSNVDRSPVKYTVSPEEHFGAIAYADRTGLTISGSFHSHVTSPPFPSQRDVDGALDPEWLYLIVGLAGVEPELHGFRIRSGVVAEVQLLELS